ncbi:MAG TPA: type II and III secretion system protein family protein [Kiloniellales bacterium]
MIKVLSHRLGIGSYVFALTVLCALFIAGPAAAQTRIVTVSDESKHAGEFVVPLNKSQILQLDVPFADLLVGNAEIADVLALTDRSVYVLGKALGSTSLTIYGRNHSLIAVIDLIVSHDIDALKARLFELMPEEKVEVRPINTGIVLSGTLSGAARMQRALTLAQQFVGGEGQVTNLMGVRGSQQVMLSVRFTEVSRSISKSLGIINAFQGGDFGLITGSPSATDGSSFTVDLEGADVATDLVASLTGFASGAGVVEIGNATLAMIFDALETKGLLKTLAEPNLVALNGDTASFLAGGEFPIEVDAGDGVTTIEFKEFGVSLSFTPTVLDDGLMSLNVAVESSSIDPTGISVETTAGTTPSLITRRANTTVELRDGQSFAIAGLLQNDFLDNIDQMPWLGDVPVLGTLFRSTDYSRKETELVILVSPRLVQPAPAGSLATPVDNFVMPSDLDLFAFGRLESPQSGIGPLGGGAGGIDGSFGHIIK